MATRISSVDGLGVSIQVLGYQQTVRALHALAPAVEKALNTEIRESLNVTRDLARSLIPTGAPMSGWSTSDTAKPRTRRAGGFPSWQPDRMRAGITVGRGSARGTRGLSSISVAWQLRSSDGAATIYDKAGQKTGGEGSGVQFIANLNRARHAQRVLWPAWLKTRTEAMRRITEAIEAAEKVLNTEIDRADKVA